MGLCLSNKLWSPVLLINQQVAGYRMTWRISSKAIGRSADDRLRDWQNQIRSECARQPSTAALHHAVPAGHLGRSPRTAACRWSTTPVRRDVCGRRTVFATSPDRQSCHRPLPKSALAVVESYFPGRSIGGPLSCDGASPAVARSTHHNRRHSAPEDPSPVLSATGDADDCRVSSRVGFPYSHQFV